MRIRPLETCIALTLCLGMSCKMSCFATPAKQIDSPISEKLNAAKAPDAVRTSRELATFDHRRFDALLRKHSRPTLGRMDYAALKSDSAELERYTESLAAVELAALGADDQKALLINAYNAFTLQLILEHYPGLESIKDLPSPWKTKRWKLAGDTVSLDDIEHGLLRPTYKDPRIHFAVNCASIGCPPLPDFAYRGPVIDSQLELVTTAALRNPRHVSTSEDKLRLTKLMSWYGDDFVGEDWTPRADSVQDFVAKYADKETRALLQKLGADARVEFADYDWQLNDIDR